VEQRSARIGWRPSDRHIERQFRQGNALLHRDQSLLMNDFEPALPFDVPDKEPWRQKAAAIAATM
jgi:hypothetical protein